MIEYWQESSEQMLDKYKMRRLGHENWDLVSLHFHDGKWHYLFKRPLKPKEQVYNPPIIKVPDNVDKENLYQEFKAALQKTANNLGRRKAK